ncbi:SOS response-associated peptidase [Marinobacter sp. CA1]|uniref:SOS response-associated peptidase n=1 Tax=Marinobacter sp. CA1 TaxID=2817656 RepID=UPI001D06E65E|nr:SOS response-associated peptidase [Marinobacter sp. CA1]UDL05828.1 SOS response-associated peptidase [Marinobacter sp. CA1]
MCGRYNVIDDPDVRHLMDILGIQLYPQTRYNIAPGGKGQIVYHREGQRLLDDAYWSLLIEPRPGASGYRPSPRYSTFNARAGKLGSSPLWQKRVRYQRAIVPASGFHEWVGERGSKQCHNIRLAEEAIAFAGLYEVWNFNDEAVTSFTIVTLSPHPRFSHIHSKSIPLMLTEDEYDLWLDPDLTTTDPLQPLLISRIRQPLVIEPIRSPESLEIIGPVERLTADGAR